MKKCFTPTLFFALLLFVGGDLRAQQNWVWDAYKISIDLPDDFQLLKNNDNEFEVEGEGMDIFMFLFEEDISLNEMKDATLSAIKERLRDIF